MPQRILDGNGKKASLENADTLFPVDLVDLKHISRLTLYSTNY